MGKRRPHPRCAVRARYPEATCIPWWSGRRAWIVLEINAPTSLGDIGAGETERRAWQDAARRLNPVDTTGVKG